MNNKDAIEKLLAEIQKLENDNGVLQRRLQEVTAENAKQKKDICVKGYNCREFEGEI